MVVSRDKTDLRTSRGPVLAISLFARRAAVVMVFRLATRILAAVIAMLVLALLSSGLALLAAWQVERLFGQAIDENIPSIRSADQLQTLLLEQRGQVASFLLDGGNRDWLDDLRSRKRPFVEWLDYNKSIAYTAEEKRILADVEQAYHVYDARRQSAIEAFEAGDKEEATRILLSDVNSAYVRLYDLCEDVSRVNQELADAAISSAKSRVRRLSLIVACTVTLTAICGAFAMHQYFRGVFFPVRQMLSEVRRFAGEEKPAAPTADELETVGDFLRVLMTDMRETRGSLEQTRRQLLHSAKLASAGKLAASVAHEIRNPLTTMKMWLFSIRKDIGASPELEEKFTVISEEIQRLETIVRNFLEFSQPPRLNVAPYAVPVLIEKAVSLVQHRLAERGIAVVQSGLQDLSPVLVDADQIKQVFLNLLLNSLEAIEPGREIRISGSATQDDPHRGVVVVRVADAGPGMADDVAARIFEPFFTTKDEGTGLGLCIAAGIMIRHGGRLLLEETSEAGTTFAVWMPLAEKEPHESCADRG